MAKLARIGVDTAKNVFHVHGVDEAEQPVLIRQLRRKQFLAFFAKLEATKVGLEACGASHHWGRELEKLGHKVVLLPPQEAKRYVERNKNDAADASAICEAMSRPRVQNRFVVVKSAEQSAAQMLLGMRDSLVRRRTQLSNTIRGYAAEFGVVTGKGLVRIEPLLASLAAHSDVPELAKEMFVLLGQEFEDIGRKLAAVEKKVMAWHRRNEVSRRLAEIPTVGPIGACLFAIKIPNPSIFSCGRSCAAWLGLTPKDHSSGGKQRHGGITRAGDEALRAALVCGATSYIGYVRRGRTKPSPWLAELLKRKPPKHAAVALANKTARIAWKLMVSGQRYQSSPATAHSAAAA